MRANEILSNLASGNRQKVKTAVAQLQNVGFQFGVLGLSEQPRSGMIRTMNGATELVTISTATQTSTLNSHQVASFVHGHTLQVGDFQLPLRVINFTDDDLKSDEIG